MPNLKREGTMKRSRVLLAAVLAVAVLATSAILGACSGGGGGGTAAQQPAPKVQLSGTIAGGSGYTFKGLNGKSLSGPSLTINKVVAIPMDGGRLAADMMRSSVTATIGGDGKFDLALTKDYDWLLVLINSADLPPSTTRFAGSIAMSFGTDSILSLPATATTLSLLSLGTITGISGDAVSAPSLTASNFSMSPAQLTAMAKSDSIFRNAKNIINNYAANGDYYQMRPDFSWTGDYSTLLTTVSAPAYTFKGMSFQLDTNTHNITMSNICSAGVTTIELVPPASISTTAGHNYAPGTPITNAGCVLSGLNGGTQAWGTDFYGTDAFSQGNMSYGIPVDFTTVPAGAWLWKENGTTRASFDVNAASPPYIASNKKPKGFVPSLKVNVGAGNKITSVDITWYYYDETGAAYIPLSAADLKLLKHFIGRFEVAFDVTYPFPGGTRTTCNMYFDPAITSNVIPSNYYDPTDPNNKCNLDWYFGNAGFPNTDTGLMGFYESGGFGYFFQFFKP
jgi:hypothetical protein